MNTAARITLALALAVAVQAQTSVTGGTAVTSGPWTDNGSTVSTTRNVNVGSAVPAGAPAQSIAANGALYGQKVVADAEGGLPANGGGGISMADSANESYLLSNWNYDNTITDQYARAGGSGLIVFIKRAASGLQPGDMQFMTAPTGAAGDHIPWATNLEMFAAGGGRAFGPWTIDDVTPGVVPGWHKYALVKIANGVNGCANANGCWQVNGVKTLDAAAGTSQYPKLFVLPAKGHVSDYRIEVASACTGTTTAVTGFGTADIVNYYALINFSIATTGIQNGPPIKTGSNKSTAVDLDVGITTTGANVDQLVAGCAINYYILWGVLP